MTGEDVKLYRLNLFNRLKKTTKTITIVFKRVKRFFLRLYLTHKYRRQSKQDSTLTVQPIRKRVYRDKCRQRYYESGCYNLRKAMAKRHMKRGKSCEEAWELAKVQISRVAAHKWKAWGI